MQDKSDLIVDSFMIGYNCEEIRFKRKLGAKLNKITLSIPNKSFDTTSNILTLIFSVKLDFVDSKENFFRFTSGFKINNIEILNDNFDQKYLPIFISSLFPYVRNYITTITNDSSNPVIIPTIDLRKINLNNSVELSFTNKKLT